MTDVITEAIERFTQTAPKKHHPCCTGVWLVTTDALGVPEGKVRGLWAMANIWDSFKPWSSVEVHPFVGTAVDEVLDLTGGLGAIPSIASGDWYVVQGWDDLAGDRVVGDDDPEGRPSSTGHTWLVKYTNGLCLVWETDLTNGPRWTHGLTLRQAFRVDRYDEVRAVRLESPHPSHHAAPDALSAPGGAVIASEASTAPEGRTTAKEGQTMSRYDMTREEAERLVKSKGRSALVDKLNALETERRDRRKKPGEWLLEKLRGIKVEPAELAELLQVVAAAQADGKLTPDEVFAIGRAVVDLLD